MSTNIAGLLRNAGKRSIAGLLEDKGRTLSNAEARKYISECQAKGWKLLPCSENCEGFDHFGGGCPGHEVAE